MSLKLTFLDAATIGSDIDLSMFERFGKLTIFQTTLQDDFIKNVADSDVIIVNKLKVGRENLPACKNVKLVCVTATGYDNIDLEYCKENNIAVCNVVGYSTQNVAQLTLAMVLSLVSHLNEYNRMVADGTYSRGKNANILTPQIKYPPQINVTTIIYVYGRNVNADKKIKRSCGFTAAPLCHVSVFIYPP